MEITLDFDCPLCNMPVSHSWEFSRQVSCPYCKQVHYVCWTFEDFEEGAKTHIEIVTYLHRIEDGVRTPYIASTINKEF